MIGESSNVAPLERGLSVAAGIALAVLALRSRPTVGVPLGLVAAAALFRGATGYCPGFAALGLSTASSDARPAAVPSRQRPAPDAVQEASEESFPASDPPAWTC